MLFACISAVIIAQVALASDGAYGRSVGLEEAADNFAAGEHIEIVVIPVAGWAVSAS
jgi:hypothetical protein